MQVRSYYLSPNRDMLATGVGIAATLAGMTYMYSDLKIRGLAFIALTPLLGVLSQFLAKALFRQESTPITIERNSYAGIVEVEVKSRWGWNRTIDIPETPLGSEI